MTLPQKYRTLLRIVYKVACLRSYLVKKRIRVLGFTIKWYLYSLDFIIPGESEKEI